MTSWDLLIFQGAGVIYNYDFNSQFIIYFSQEIIIQPDIND